MTDKPLPQYEEIEKAFDGARDVVNRIPAGTEQRRALDHLKMAEGYTSEARERAKVIDREATTEAAAPQWIRGPALAGRPWRQG